jgi:hypothetical protein
VAVGLMLIFLTAQRTLWAMVITVRLGPDDWMLVRVSVICRVAVTKKRAVRNLAAEEQAPGDGRARDHVALELKICEICSKSFLRPIGSDVKLCAGRHTAPVRPGDLQRLEAALLEARESERRRKGARIRVAARG